jgi:hypothetical protein
METSPRFLALSVLVTCIPCLLIPFAAALIAAGAFSGVLGLLGLPWVLAFLAGVPMAGTLVVLHLRRRGASCAVSGGPQAQSTQ